MLVEETAIPATHVSVGDHPAFTDPNGAQIFKAIHEAALVDPVGQRPVLFRNELVVAFR